MTLVTFQVLPKLLICFLYLQLSLVLKIWFLWLFVVTLIIIMLNILLAVPFQILPIDRFHNWWPINYCFVYVLIRPTSLILKEHFFCILSMLTRLVGLINTKTQKDPGYFFPLPFILCNRSIGTSILYLVLTLSTTQNNNIIAALVTNTHWCGHWTCQI